MSARPRVIASYLGTDERTIVRSGATAAVAPLINDPGLSNPPAVVSAHLSQPKTYRRAPPLLREDVQNRLSHNVLTLV